MKHLSFLSLFRSLQIKLSRKIQVVDSCYSIKVSSLQVDIKYPITHDEKGATRFGPAIVFAIRDTPDRILKVFMPRRFYSAFSNEDFEEINSEKVALNLVYKGQYVNTHTFKVTIESH